MRVRIQTWRLPKDGSSEGEYEDAFYPEAPDPVELDQPWVKIAVADGATETSFSREWANDLVHAYIRYPRHFHRNDSLAQLVRDLGAHFNPRVEQTLAERDVPWYVEQKAREGAFAAVLGLTLWECPGRAVWSACAIGDCCLFQIRNGELLERFPLTHAANFGNRPFLVSSRPERNAALLHHRRLRSGTWRYGDELLLMSDALACWFLRRWELRSDPLGLLAHLSTNDDFAQLVGRERVARLDGVPLLRNDDVTLVRCLIH
jgi:hypothetical protein